VTATRRSNLAIGDRSLGFWIALQEEYGSSSESSGALVHQTANILDKVPKKSLSADKPRPPCSSPRPTAAFSLQD
jgi:hypothetical protein